MKDKLTKICLRSVIFITIGFISDALLANNACFKGRVLLDSLPYPNAQIYLVNHRYKTLSDNNGHYEIPLDIINSQDSSYVIIYSSNFPSIIEKIEPEYLINPSKSFITNDFSRLNYGNKSVSTQYTYDIYINGSLNGTINEIEEPVIIGNNITYDRIEIKEHNNYSLSMERSPRFKDFYLFAIGKEILPKIKKIVLNNSDRRRFIKNDQDIYLSPFQKEVTFILNIISSNTKVNGAKVRINDSSLIRANNGNIKIKLPLQHNQIDYNITVVHEEYDLKKEVHRYVGNGGSIPLTINLTQKLTNGTLWLRDEYGTNISPTYLSHNENNVPFSTSETSTKFSTKMMIGDTMFIQLPNHFSPSDTFIVYKGGLKINVQIEVIRKPIKVILIFLDSQNNKIKLDVNNYKLFYSDSSSVKIIHQVILNETDLHITFQPKKFGNYFFTFFSPKPRLIKNIFSINVAETFPKLIQFHEERVGFIDLRNIKNSFDINSNYKLLPKSTPYTELIQVPTDSLCLTFSNPKYVPYDTCLTIDELAIHEISFSPQLKKGDISIKIPTEIILKDSIKFTLITNNTNDTLMQSIKLNENQSAGLFQYGEYMFTISDSLYNSIDTTFILNSSSKSLSANLKPKTQHLWFSILPPAIYNVTLQSQYDPKIIHNKTTDIFGTLNIPSVFFGKYDLKIISKSFNAEIMKTVSINDSFTNDSFKFNLSSIQKNNPWSLYLGADIGILGRNFDNKFRLGCEIGFITPPNIGMSIVYNLIFDNDDFYWIGSWYTINRSVINVPFSNINIRAGIGFASAFNNRIDPAFLGNVEYLLKDNIHLFFGVIEILPFSQESNIGSIDFFRMGCSFYK